MAGSSRLITEVAPDRRSFQVRRVGGGPLLTHRIPEGRRPSIHPLNAPDGNGVFTEDSPAHHPWQCGLYTGFNLVNGVGFWRDRPDDGTFDPGLVAGPDTSGAVVTWSIENSWTAPDGTTLIVERQDWQFRDEESTYDLDLNWSLHAEVDVEIGQFMAGGLFLRMPWASETGGVVINSEGLQNSAAEKQRARWTAVSMPISGRRDWGGVAIMDHPGNPAHPVTWRVDNELGISPSRCIAESWTIPNGATEHYRFRLHVFTGQIVESQIEDRWHRFAADEAMVGPE